MLKKLIGRENNREFAEIGILINSQTNIFQNEQKARFSSYFNEILK